jgi:cobalamin biosynthesis Mg chelatase CobN
MRTTTNSVPNPQAASNQSYPPSVPLSVYRDLAEELQAAREMVNSLTLKNHQLAQKNQVLQREITKAVHAIAELQHCVDVPESSTVYNPDAHAFTNFNHEVKQTSAEACSDVRTQKVYPPRTSANSSAPKKIKIKKPSYQEAIPDYFPVNKPVYIEEQEVRYYTPKRKAEATETNGWMLLIAILLVVVTAFGAGYLVVRPLLQSQSS